MDGLHTYVVLFRDDSLLPADAPLAFRCEAEEPAHAEEQCENAYPEAEVVWVCITGDINMAYQDYWFNAVYSWSSTVH